MTANIDVDAGLLVHALGPLRVGGDRAGEVTAEKPQRLLAALALAPNRWVSTAELTEALWPEGAPASARGNLKTYVHMLRQLLPAAGDQPRIDSRRGSYRLVVERRELDVTAFEDLVRDARDALSSNENSVAMECAEAALALWRGEPYESLSGVSVEVERVRLAELRHAAEDCLADGMLAAGRAEDAIGLLRPLATANPLREATWVRLMRALMRTGRPADAMRAYHDLRKVLADELGTEPGPGPRAVYDELLEADRAAGRVQVPFVRPAARRHRWWLVLAAVVALVAGGVVWWTVDAPPADLATALAVPIKKRPVPLPPPGRVVFGLGEHIDSVLSSPLYPFLGMVTQRYDDVATLQQLPGWRKGSVARAYAAGKAIHLMIGKFDDADDKRAFTVHGTGVCGAAYPLSERFLSDMRELALAFAGKAGGPPLFVSAFVGADQMGCGQGLNDAAENRAYYTALKARYLQVVAIFHAYAANSLVALDLDGWLNSFADTGPGDGRTMLHFFDDVLARSDFQSFGVFEKEDNVEAMSQMLAALHRFGPAMVSQYRPYRHGDLYGIDAFDRETAQLFGQEAALRRLAGAGLFAFDFWDDTQLGSTPQRLARVRTAIEHFGATR
ncbi:AfsR/SARP family transcriptional regulator [Fodinicola acaciae]|uniref:AfsR/SARP family transcriptional regulator n=1 Tax=Fodinicola acaciae TaxID=2681555 RepID=UPI0013D31E36|nr:BTAD domain-containing putative transcriptional regulator [Fodinicola acaciae]